MAAPRIKIPESARIGDIIDIKSVITHPMETGNRKDGEGRVIPRNIVNSFTASFEGRTIFRAELGSGISANPYLSFSMRVTGPGTFLFTWTDDGGAVVTHSARLAVTG